jgi:uncharacterized RDD family membrane protein YckC
MSNRQFSALRAGIASAAVVIAATFAGAAAADVQGAEPLERSVDYAGKPPFKRTLVPASPAYLASAAPVLAEEQRRTRTPGKARWTTRSANMETVEFARFEETRGQADRVDGRRWTGAPGKMRRR